MRRTGETSNEKTTTLEILIDVIALLMLLLLMPGEQPTVVQSEQPARAMQAQPVSVPATSPVTLDQPKAEPAPKRKTDPAPQVQNIRHRRVVVSIPDRKLALMEGDRVLAIYPVAVGAHVSPSPTGDFTIRNRVVDPTYYHPGEVIPAGSDNPVGPRWIGLSKAHYAIHGTNEPRSIGKAASHGCIRMSNRDVTRLFAEVRVGDTVEIHGERDGAVAQVFGGIANDSSTVAQSGSSTVPGSF